MANNDPDGSSRRERMNNSNSNIDTSKPTGQAPFVQKGESQNEAQPAKVEEPKPGTDTDRQVTGESKLPASDDAKGTSLR
jgi:hypothetical protein